MDQIGDRGPKALDKLVSGEIVAACEAYENLRFFCDEGGGRFGGSAGEVRVRDFLLARLRDYGLENVHIQEYAYAGWVRGEASLRVSAPSRVSGLAGVGSAEAVDYETVEALQTDLPCFSLPHSPSGDVEAEVVFVGAGGPREFEEAGDVAGKAVIVTNEAPTGLGRMVHRSEKYGRAMRADAAAFIYMRMGSMLAETGTVRHNETGAIPAVSVTRESGMALRRLMEKGPVRVRVKTTDRCEPMTGWNIVGEITGAAEPGKVVLVGAHIDGHDISQAAADNGGGSAAILEAARALAMHRDMLPKTVRFVWFTGEEIGLLGSNSYAKKHVAQAEDIEFVFNCDVAGGGGTPSITAMGFDETRRRFVRMSHELNLPLRVGVGVMPYSDMYPFHLLGIPSVSFSSSAPDGSWNFVHTAADTFDKMTPRGLMLDSLAVARLLAHILFSDPIPHKNPDEVSASIASLREAFELEGRMPDGASRGL